MRLFHAQSFHWIDRGRFLRRDDAGKHGCESKREYTPKKDQWIAPTDLIQLGGNQAGTSNRNRNTDQEACENLQEGSAEDKLYDIVAIRAEGHAHANFTGAPFHGISSDTVKADGGKDEGENAEQPSHLGGGAPLIEIRIDVVLHGFEIQQGDVGINLTHHMANLRLESFHAAVIFKDGAFDVV